VIFYTASLVVFAVTLCRINGGLKTTYQSRRQVLIRTAIILAIYMMYVRHQSAVPLPRLPRERSERKKN
jgi:hypothetical protein